LIESICLRAANRRGISTAKNKALGIAGLSDGQSLDPKIIYEVGMLHWHRILAKYLLTRVALFNEKQFKYFENLSKLRIFVVFCRLSS